MENILEEAFEWRTVLNDLKSMKCLIEIVELEQSEVARQLEIQIVNTLSTLSPATQRRVKDLAFARAGINPWGEGPGVQKFNELKYQLNLRFKSGSDLYDFVCNEIHDPPQKFKWMSVAAEKGYAEAQVFVAWCFQNGECGCIMNIPKAKYWYIKAAKQNNVEAQYILDYLANLEPVFKEFYLDEKEGKDLYCYTMKTYTEKIAVTSNDKSEIAGLEYKLGQCYQYGYGVAMDKKQAYQYYIQSSEKGNNDALVQLGFMYDEDSDVNVMTAKQCIDFLYKAAARKENTCAQERLALLLKNKEYGPVQRQESLNWRTIAAEQGDSLAMYNLGLLYFYGSTEEQKKENFVIEKNEEKAIQMFIGAATKGDLDACHYLGDLNLEEYKGIKTKTSLEWLTWAAVRGHVKCQCELGLMIGNAKSGETPVQWYLKAANRDHKFALYHLGRYYCDVKGDRSLAIKWFTLGANKEDVNCQYALAKLYEIGSLEERKMCKKWMTKAAEQKFEQAIKWLNIHP